MRTSTTKDVFPQVEQLLGRTPDDMELETFLKSLGMWPLPSFEPEEFRIYLEDKERGFCLVFKDCSTVQHPSTVGKPAETPVLACVFLYAEDVDGYHAYMGALPLGIIWSDTASLLVAKNGPPKQEIRNKTTGKLNAQRWPVGPWMLTVGYIGDGASIDRIDLGIY